MTDCPAGGEPKPTAPDFYTFAEADMVAGFGAYAGWFTTAAMGLPQTPQVTATLCASPPPTELPTTEDWLKLVSPPIALVTGTYTRFGNQIRAEKWSELCQCPAVPGGECYDSGWGSYNVPFNTFDIKVTSSVQTYITSFHVQWVLHQPQPGWGWTLEVQVRNKATLAWSSAYLQNNRPDWPSEMQEYGPWSVTANTYDQVRVGIAYNANSLSMNMDIRLMTTCTAGAPVVIDPPVLVDPPGGYPLPPDCPTSPGLSNLCDLLYQVSRKVDALTRLVTLLQGYEMPFGYQLGDVHAGLTGESEFAVQGLIGLQIALTTVPSTMKRLQGNPDYLWDVGWCSIGRSAGMLEEKRIARSAFQWFPDQMVLASKFSWYLPAGVTMQVTELLPQA